MRQGHANIENNLRTSQRCAATMMCSQHKIALISNAPQVSPPAILFSPISAAATMSSPKESTEAQVNEAIERVASKKAEWARLPAAEKATLLQECLNNLKNEIEPWANNGELPFESRAQFVMLLSLLTSVFVCLFERSLPQHRLRY